MNTLLWSVTILAIHRELRRPGLFDFARHDPLWQDPETLAFLALMVTTLAIVVAADRRSRKLSAGNQMPPSRPTPLLPWSDRLLDAAPTPLLLRIEFYSLTTMNFVFFLILVRTVATIEGYPIASPREPFDIRAQVVRGLFFFGLTIMQIGLVRSYEARSWDLEEEAKRFALRRRKPGGPPD